MTDYREIIRLHSLKFSNVSIANSLCCSCNTVSEVLKLAETHSLEWPIPETLSNKDISEKAQSCKNLSAVLNSVIPMRVWKILSIILTEIWIKDRCWNSPPAGIYLMTTISF